VPRNALNKAIVTYACILIDDESAESIRSTTSDALNSVDPDMDTESFVWVVDGQWPDEDNGYEPDYRGLYRVRLKHLFDAFYHSVFDYSAMEEMDPERDGGEEKFWQYEAM
jgi:hypothetical protein